ncbi:MAG TPA: peptidylprolyl isomerase [Xanthomonadales bacterium]|nr:peptidylprolyl isomerase [Xanthomonadales bacterium]
MKIITVKFRTIGIMACLLVGLGILQGLQAQDGMAAAAGCTDPQHVLACQGRAVLTQAAIDGAFSRVPDDVRLDFIRDGAKVDQMIKDLLQIELLALDAEASGFAQDALVQQRVMLAARTALADAWTEELARRAPEVDYAAIAHEDYLVNPQTWSSEATVSVTHILISTNSRTQGEGEKIARELHDRLLLDPKLFDALVLEYSDDPGKNKNGGKYADMKYAQLVKPFADVAFAMQTPGEISPPVETEYGYHLIRLDGKKEAVLQAWDGVEAEAIEKAKAKHVKTYRANYVKKLLNSPVVFPDGAVDVMARRWFGENLEKAPIFTEDGVE